MIENLKVFAKLSYYAKHKYSKLLDKTEFLALSEYTLFSYYFINNQLRQVTGEAETITKTITAIDSALSKFSLDIPIKVYRRVSLNKIEDYERERNNAYSGLMIDSSFASTSLIKRIGSINKKDSGYRNLFYNMEIEVPSTLCGAYIAPFSQYEYREYEFLIKRDIPIEILDVNEFKDGSKRHMDIKGRVLMK